MSPRPRSRRSRPAPLIDSVALTTAEELLDELTPHRAGRLWRGRRADNEWLFRGQSDASWGLTPSAFRRGGLSQLLLDRADEERYPALEHRRIEHDQVLRFAAQADASGHTLFGDSPVLRARAPTDDQLVRDDFPPEEFRGHYALAQHYGVATRLLDWTLRPLVAAYFACVHVAEWSSPPHTHVEPPPEGLPEECAVWAASQAFIRQCAPPRVAIITAAAAAIPNLRAQQARFTLVRSGRVEPGQVERLLPLDKALSAEGAGAADREPWMTPALVQFTLPRSEARHLLYLLRLTGVSAASVFTGLDAVYRALLEENWEDRRNG